MNPSYLSVLVLDDVREQVDLLAMLLGLWGHEPLRAYDGPTAIKLAHLHRPDVAILDFGLPGNMDGCDLAGRPEMRQSLLVALTGYAGDCDRQRALEAGFDYFLVKPVGPEILRKLLKSYAQFLSVEEECRQSQLVFSR
jgi:CheY-like chemotaxis protein